MVTGLCKQPRNVRNHGVLSSGRFYLDMTLSIRSRDVLIGQNNYLRMRIDSGQMLWLMSQVSASSE